MAYVQVLQVLDAPMEEYHRVHEHLAPRVQPGLVAGVAAPVGDGFCVVSIWESKTDLDRFVAEQLGPAIVATGATGTPEIVVSADGILLSSEPQPAVP